MDSTEVPVYGRQEHSAYNGHFESTCYHPLLLFSREGDCLAAKLRPGNVHSADDWEELLLPEIERQQAQGKEVAFRGDAAFAKPEIYEALEERDVKYAIRLPANDNLQRKIMELLTRPVGRPSHKPVFRFNSFLYQAASWTMTRRVVAKVEFHSGELFPRVGFIVTNLGTSSRAVVRFYNKRGPALFVGLGGFFAFLENVAQVGLARLNPVAEVDKKIQRDRRFQDLFFDLLLAGLDPLGDLNLLLAREQLEVAHLLEVEPYRVGRIARRVGSLFFGLFFGLRVNLALRALGGDFLEDLDIHVLEALQRGAKVGGRGHVLGQEIVDLVESQVTLLATEVD